MPSSRRSPTSRTRSAAKAYPAASATASSGPTWAPHRGRPAARCPTSSRNMLAEQARPRSRRCFRDCNWMQGLEGDIDTSHLAYLHLGAIKPDRDDARHIRLLHGCRPRAPLRRGGHRVRHLLRRLPSGRGRHLLLARRALPLPVLHHDPNRRSGRAGPGQRLGAYRRRPHDVLELRCTQQSRSGPGQSSGSQRLGGQRRARSPRGPARPPGGSRPGRWL